MSRAQVVATTLSQEEQRETAHVIAAIVATQNRPDYEKHPLQTFFECLKNSLMQATPPGTKPSIIDSGRGINLNADAAEHLSETLRLLRSDNIVTTLKLRLGDDPELMEALDLSCFPASITTILLGFENPEMAEEFWPKIEALLVTNTTLTDINTVQSTPVPEAIQAILTRNREWKGMSLAAVPNPTEQQARALLFGELALTNSQKQMRHAEETHSLTIGHDTKIASHGVQIVSQGKQIANHEVRLTRVEAAQQNVGRTLLTLANNSSAISDGALAELERSFADMDISSAGKSSGVVTEEDQYIRDFKFLFHSVLLHGQVKNMADLNTVGGVDTESGVNAAKMFGSLGRIAGKFVESLPFGAAAGAMVGAVAKVATDRVERGFWKNIVQLSNDGDSAYIDVLSSSLAAHYANHRFEPLERNTALGAIGGFINDLIGKSVSTGRIRSVNPKAADDIKHLFSQISRYRSVTISPDARTMAVVLYQIKHPEAAVNDNRGMKYSSAKETEVRLPAAYGSTARANIQQKGSPMGSARSYGSDTTTQEAGSRNGSDDSVEKELMRKAPANDQMMPSQRVAESKQEVVVPITLHPNARPFTDEERAQYALRLQNARDFLKNDKIPQDSKKCKERKTVEWRIGSIIDSMKRHDEDLAKGESGSGWRESLEKQWNSLDKAIKAVEDKYINPKKSMFSWGR